MITSELVRHLARELRIPETELQAHADKLDSAGMLDGDDISKAAVLLIAAATGDGDGGIVERVKARADMYMAETNTVYPDGEDAIRASKATGDGADDHAEARERSCRPFGEFVRDMVRRQMNGQLRNGRIVSISVSQSRPIGIIELACGTKYTDGVGTALFADIPKSVFETGKTANIPELITGMETVATINGDVVDAMAVLIRADKAAA